MRSDLLNAPTVWPLAIFAAGLLCAAVMDLRARRIPNLLVAPLFAAGVTYNMLVGGWSGGGRALGGALLGIVILIVPFGARLIGGGDVKLLGAIGAWLGVSNIVWVSIWAAACCGLLVVGLLVRHRALRSAVATNLTTAVLQREVPTVEARPRAQSVPIGAALATAALWVAIGEGAFPRG